MPTPRPEAICAKLAACDGSAVLETCVADRTAAGSVFDPACA
ncbi:hypothetical protein OV203_36150 [Nannocystis sp. ILAH1]|nr:MULTISPECIES: hypothetical protein [unclassified Nannocystis]MCY0992629.1 hypothetical protein [Nannocystis sp. ILAH1]MCY1070141.1 hypothetical protein [Nannocystis sp. RBIL2]